MNSNNENVIEYNKNTDYPLGTIVNTEFGKAIVEKDCTCSCGNGNCIFYSKSGNCNGKCTSYESLDVENIYFKPLKENEIMEKRTLEISLDKARELYKNSDSSMKELLLSTFTKEELEHLPSSWNEYEENCDSELLYDHSRMYDVPLDCLQRLLVLRDVYRQGWKPNWNDTKAFKYCIAITYNSTLIIQKYTTIAYMFSFPTEELAEQFLKNFKEELEEIKELL